MRSPVFRGTGAGGHSPCQGIEPGILQGTPGPGPWGLGPRYSDPQNPKMPPKTRVTIFPRGAGGHSPCKGILQGTPVPGPWGLGPRY